jgi:GT2 family glycosyltransferase
VAEGRLLAFLNNDTLPARGWLDALARTADEHPGTGIVGALLLWPDNTVQHAGVVFDSGRNGRHLYVGLPERHEAVRRPRRLQAVTGAAMLVERELFERLGGFDPTFVNGWEDIDLCLRAGELGAEVRLAPDAVVRHLEGATRGREFTADLPNYHEFMRRWKDRIEQDDVVHWANDGLLRAEHRADGTVELEVAPELGEASPGPGLERLLAERTSQALELTRANVRLSLAAEPPADAWNGIRRGPPRGDAPSVSVVVPVGHHGTLGALVRALAPQVDALAGGELIVSSDPETLAHTLPEVRPEERPRRFEVVEAGSEGNRATHLNRAIEQSSGELVVLLVDDFMPGPGFLAAHLAVHRAEPRPQVAAIGPALFPERLRAEPFRRWLEDSGELFGCSFTSPEGPPERFWFCANTSLKRAFLLQGQLFDERLDKEAWDDHELGLRLFDRGMEVVFAPAAAVVHEHPLDLDERRQVMRNAGEAAATFDSIYPRPHPFWSGTDPWDSVTELRLRAALLRARHRLRGREEDLYAAFHAEMRSAFLEGYRCGLSGRATTAA